MDADNPYAPPRAPLVLPCAPATQTLASRWLRLFAALIDTILVISLQFFVLIGWFGLNPSGAGHTFDYIFSEDTIYAAASSVGWIVVNIWLLAQGQTFGKRMLAIRVVRTDGQRVSLGRMIFARIVPIDLMGWIPLVGPWLALASVLLIFGRSRRCLHDYIADTIVVRA